jgi:hypothetical protein
MGTVLFFFKKFKRSKNLPPKKNLKLSSARLCRIFRISRLSRVDRFLPIPQVEVCFLRLPPGFPAVPQYLNNESVGRKPSHTVRPDFCHPYHNY